MTHKKRGNTGSIVLILDIIIIIIIIIIITDSGIFNINRNVTDELDPLTTKINNTTQTNNGTTDKNDAGEGMEKQLNTKYNPCVSQRVMREQET